MKFSFIPAPTADQTPAQRAEELVYGAVVNDNGKVELPSDAARLAVAVSGMKPRERDQVIVYGSSKELAHVAITTLSQCGVQYTGVGNLSFSPNVSETELERFFARALPVDAPEAATDVTAESVPELDEALEHLKKAGEALKPLVIRGSKELFSELKTLFR